MSKLIAILAALGIVALLWLFAVPMMQINSDIQTNVVTPAINPAYDNGTAITTITYDNGTISMHNDIHGSAATGFFWVIGILFIGAIGWGVAANYRSKDGG